MRRNKGKALLVVLAVLAMATTAFGQDDQKLKRFDGVTITIATLAAGPEGVISGPVYKRAEEWSRLTGGQVEVAEIPFSEVHTKVMADLYTGIGIYDGFLAQAWFYGDYMAGDYVVPIDDYMNDPGFPQFNNNAVLPAVANLLHWGDQQYAPPFDGDEFILWYRKDVLADPAFAEPFRAAYGYELPNPPQTIDQLIDVAAFFQGKDWSGDGSPDYGIAMSLKSGQGLAQYWYQAIAAPYAILPGPVVDRYHNVFWFDPDTLEPLINKPGHVRGLEKLVELATKGQPEAGLAWDLGQSWSVFLDGKSVFALNTADIASGAQSSKAVKGQLGGIPIPGATEVYNRETGSWETFDDPNVVGNLLGANWNGTISKFSDHPEAVYSFFAYLATQENLTQAAYAGGDGIDPTSEFQFLPPLGNANVEGYVKAGWNPEDARTYSDALYANLAQVDTYLPYLRTRGTASFQNALDAAITNVLAERAEPQEALDGVAEAWQRTIDSLGADSFKQEYRTSIGYGEAPKGP
ncbi:MAG TPA: extracellular solute-binding protein [Trueperaceae bacterium]